MGNGKRILGFDVGNAKLLEPGLALEVAELKACAFGYAAKDFLGFMLVAFRHPEGTRLGSP